MCEAHAFRVTWSELVLSRMHHPNALTEKALGDAVQCLGVAMSGLATSRPRLL